MYYAVRNKASAKKRIGLNVNFKRIEKKSVTLLLPTFE